MIADGRRRLERVPDGAPQPLSLDGASAAAPLHRPLNLAPRSLLRRSAARLRRTVIRACVHGLLAVTR